MKKREKKETRTHIYTQPEFRYNEKDRKKTMQTTTQPSQANGIISCVKPF